jgi:hypothetical protein
VKSSSLSSKGRKRQKKRKSERKEEARKGHEVRDIGEAEENKNEVRESLEQDR